MRVPSRGVHCLRHGLRGRAFGDALSLGLEGDGLRDGETFVMFASLGRSGAPRAAAARVWSARVRAAARNMPSVTRLAREAMTPKPAPGKMLLLSHWPMWWTVPP